MLGLRPMSKIAPLARHAHIPTAQIHHIPAAGNPPAATTRRYFTKTPPEKSIGLKTGVSRNSAANRPLKNQYCELSVLCVRQTSRFCNWLYLQSPTRGVAEQGLGKATKTTQINALIKISYTIFSAIAAARNIVILIFISLLFRKLSNLLTLPTFEVIFNHFNICKLPRPLLARQHYGIATGDLRSMNDPVEESRSRPCEILCS